MPPAITYNDKEKLVAVLAELSDNAVPPGPPYFQNLVKQADFSTPIRGKGLAGYVGDSSFNARQLVNFATVTVGTNPKTGDAALGSILMPLLQPLQVGVEHATLFAGLIVSYELVKNKEVREELRARYQIPERPVGDAAAELGPSVQWAADTEKLELQGWFTPDPDWLDMSLVINAANRARSVCRVEVPGLGSGTGLLLRSDLVLTNYHVLGKTLDVPKATLETNAPGTVLRFGAFTAEGPAKDGQEVHLAAEKPIVAGSAKYDFALLRTDGHAADMLPFDVLGAKPAVKSAVYILQHPEGGPMKLGLSPSGIAWIDPAAVTIQYTTKVAGGSSGSPCFDADWNLVALHHAKRGSKGEGILMASIFEQIKEYLA
jgi:endonuclease G